MVFVSGALGAILLVAMAAMAHRANLEGSSIPVSLEILVARLPVVAAAAVEEVALA